jgi:hypothetical protein
MRPRLVTGICSILSPPVRTSATPAARVNDPSNRKRKSIDADPVREQG